MRGLEEAREENGSNGSFLLDQEGLIILKCLMILPEDNVLEMYSKSRSTSMYLLQLLSKEKFQLTINTR